MENFIKIVSKHFASILLMIIGTFVPGTLTLAIFNRELFLAIDIIRLIMLSFAIGASTSVILFFLMLSSMEVVFQERETEIALSYAFSDNIFIYGIALIVKIFIRDLSLKFFVCIILAGLSVSYIIWLLIKNRISEQIKKENR